LKFKDIEEVDRKCVRYIGSIVGKWKVCRKIGSGVGKQEVL